MHFTLISTEHRISLDLKILSRLYCQHVSDILDIFELVSIEMTKLHYGWSFCFSAFTN